MGFGFADVVVAVSEYWIDVSTMADLDDVCAAYAATHRRRHGFARQRADRRNGFHRYASPERHRDREAYVRIATDGLPRDPAAGDGAR